MKTFAAVTLAVAAVAAPSMALAGAQGVARSCGKIEIATAKPALGFAQPGTWFLNDFAPAKAKLIPCATVRVVARRYIATGKHPGYVVRKFKGLTGRNFYKGNVAADIGFQVYRPTT